MTALLKVDNLTQHFTLGGGLLRAGRTLYAVDAVSFELEAGQTLGLVGESGCGKSTLARALLKLHEPTSGRILYDGTDITDYSRRQMQPLRRQMQMVFQDPQESLNGRHTIGTLLQEPFVIHRLGNWRERQCWAAELLERVGLPASALERFPHEFSGGQRQRIGIARAMALNPRLLVCDEAVSALDVSVQSQILNLLLSLQQERGLAMLFIAHDLSVVKHVSDHIAVMYLGRIVELAPAEELYHQPYHPYTRVLISAIPRPTPKERQLPVMLSGELPSPANPPSGCHFRTRCPYAGERCAIEVPYLDGEAHKVACHYHREIASGARQPCANMQPVTLTEGR
ncbi:ABC transporter ATP-binding protein [Oceanimonas baumannii]|uniref:Oligopeptide/dipeptide ABC transporter ATP-binding protein n=1 Tax=Oceanimonas baumannii TaxID=129578 RepID=A0A235C9X8_9GAMM|nr:oligopeptide/dipeptide ABC transporter ATP-binding protein [Oceanimonas baumannii]OYD21244.1 peptide ABC transporter substrate-binding protein [Oceanimonas baumannii]TDW55376.1 oligopeptide/dipeptide ABC transporter ATP-binding protein [Oceanimonas baumannii]